jgi:hypothetical protein
MAERRLIRAIYDGESVHRVAIYRRPDGCFDYAAEVRRLHSAEDVLPSWMPDFEPSSSGIYDSAETAMREAEIDVRWLAEQARRPNSKLRES